MVDNSELLQRIEKLEKQVELLQAEITAIKNIEVSEKAREQIDKMERANKLVSLMENLSGEKMPDAQKNDELEVLHNISQQAEKEVQSSMGAIEEFIDNSADESDFEWQPYQDGVKITKYVGFSKETVIVPEMINDLPVRKIGEKVFLNCKEIYYILLPETIVELGESVFEASDLKEIKIPINVKEIPCCAFSWCNNLNKIQLPNTLKVIENSAFNGASITSIVFPDSGIVFGEYIIGDHYCKAVKLVFCGKNDIFDGIIVEDYVESPGFVFYCLPGSSAQKYAREHNIPIKPLSDFEKDIQEGK